MVVEDAWERSSGLRIWLMQDSIFVVHVSDFVWLGLNLRMDVVPDQIFTISLIIA